MRYSRIRAAICLLRLLDLGLVRFVEGIDLGVGHLAGLGLELLAQSVLGHPSALGLEREEAAVHHALDRALQRLVLVAIGGLLALDALRLDVLERLARFLDHGVAIDGLVTDPRQDLRNGGLLGVVLRRQAGYPEGAGDSGDGCQPDDRLRRPRTHPLGGHEELSWLNDTRVVTSESSHDSSRGRRGPRP